MRLIRHPLVSRDLIALVDHIVDVTQGDFAAAARRLDEIDALIRNVAASPQSGTRLRGALEGWLVGHGGLGHRVTIVFRTDMDREDIHFALVAFGGQDWMTTGARRREWG